MDNLSSSCQKPRRRNFYNLVYIFLPLSIAIYSFIICILHYQHMYDGLDLYVFVMHFRLLVLSLPAMFILKLILQDKVKLRFLMPIVFVATIFFGVFFDNALNYDGFLYPLIDKGGPLYFLRVGDYDMDGNYELREIISDFEYIDKEETESTSDFDVLNVRVHTKVIAKSDYFNSLEVDEEKCLITLKTKGKSANIKYVEYLIDLKNEENIKRVKFYLCDKAGEKNGYLVRKTVDENTVKLVIEEDALEKFTGSICYVYE